MAIARLHGGPLDGQVLPLGSLDQDSIVVPYAQTQLTYLRRGELINTGEDDGPTEAAFWFAEAADDLNSEA